MQRIVLNILSLTTKLDCKQMQIHSDPNNIENSAVDESEKIQSPKVKKFECTICLKRFRSKDNKLI